MVAIGFRRLLDLKLSFSDRLRAGLQKEVPESPFRSEKHGSMFKNVIGHCWPFLLWSFRLRVASGGAELRPGGLGRLGEAHSSRTVA